MTRRQSILGSVVALSLSYVGVAHAVTGGGDVPIPSKWLNGEQVSTWDGAYSDLLAADALAMCWSTQMARAADPYGSEYDGVIYGLMSKMLSASCYSTCNDVSLTGWQDVAVCAYLQSRKDPYCNVDAATKQPKALDVSRMRSSYETVDYVLPSQATLTLTGGGAPASLSLAQGELSYAELSLCMAEQLSQKLDTAQVAFASGDDLARVQEYVRERALTAVYEYGVITKALSTTVAPATALADTLFHTIPWVLWRNRAMTAANATRLGDDFAEAIKLLVESTEASIEFKLREPAAQTSFGTPNWTGGTFSGLTGPRSDVIEKVLYDGYDQTASTKRRSVLTDMSAPQVGVLLGFARAANALKIRVNGNPQIVAATNASTLLLAVENYVRNVDCTNAGTPAGSCVLATGSTPAASYVTWLRYGITANHAQALVDALAEALFGPPTPDARAAGQWTYPPLFAAGTTGPSGPAEQLTMHFFGRHSFTGSIGTTYPTGDVVIDPTFTVGGPRASDIQAMRPPVALPTRDVNPNGTASAQIGWFRYLPLNGIDAYGYPTDRRLLGSNTVLALAREALLVMAPTTSVAKGIYTQAAPAVGLIEKVIGPRQVLVRQQLKTTAASGSCTGCVALSPNTTTAAGVTTNFVNVDLITKSTDPFSRIAIAPGIPLASTLAMNANTTTIFGGTQANAIANLTYAAPAATTLAQGYVSLNTSGSWLSSSPRGVSVVLKSTTATPSFEHVFTGMPNAAIGTGVIGTAVTFGGRFDREVADAWNFERGKWFSPKYDGFGLPRTWTPAADASLLGDTPGVSVERHFLDRATTAADESAAALQQAFEVLQQQTIDDAAILSSDARSKSLTQLQQKALCGTTMPNCARSFQRLTPTIPACPAPASTTCDSFRTALGRMMGPLGVPVATPVSQEIIVSNPAPTFDKFRGGQLQQLFLAQWNNWQSLMGSLSSAVANVRAAIAQQASAAADATAANAEYSQVQADVNAAYAMLGAQQAMFNSQKTMYEAQVEGARKVMVDIECSDAAREGAVTAGYSDSGDEDVYVTETPTEWTIHNVDNTSWSSAPAIAQIQRCQLATNAYNTAVASTKGQKDAIDLYLKAIDAQLNQPNNPLAKREAAAMAHREASYARQASATQAVAAAQAQAAMAVQTAFGQLLSSVAAVDGAFTQAELAMSRIAVDQQQANYDIRTRFGVKNRFHSYDLWRARAVTENARRLALAARRAIESRYLVDLSAMTASEPFVDSPALWADQIYASDLKPFSIGLTSSPTGGSGIYTSAVRDYVNNLKLFLDGFTVQRPTANVLADAEVIQIPAPAAQVVTSSYSANFAYIDPRSAGWTFYCPNTGTWIANPDVAKWTTTTPAWTLSAACGGSAPTLARYSFELDPWGQANGWISSRPYSSRYNVRMRSLALNLVGSGIRSCQKAPDPLACYAEPFTRYDLRHVGPAWITGYDGAWRSLDIPQGTIEAGKALAAEEWLDPVSNGFARQDVAAISRPELVGRPIGGAYELTLRLTPDVNIERIERIQLLAQTEYWVRQQ